MGANVISIGTDLVEKNRIEKLWDRFGDRFALRILSQEENKVFSELKHPRDYLAKRYAGKEAVSKVLGTGIGLVRFQEISILNTDLGKPYVTLSGNAADVAHKLGIREILISLSDERAYALAFAIAI